ncbi:hypothetical protein HPB50_017671 [Hyalomma asiaticum]|uniref:Uncharacterized protein n=1 Tax=Hyalomma asiaticum TaxID=266040 RepID=A0ACB7SGG8_HYAAI|nr:hypothetical protein HPB50_017671 [Hyalomma asiaticum]
MSLVHAASRLERGFTRLGTEGLNSPSTRRSGLRILSAANMIRVCHWLPAVLAVSALAKEQQRSPYDSQRPMSASDAARRFDLTNEEQRCYEQQQFTNIEVEMLKAIDEQLRNGEIARVKSRDPSTLTQTDREMFRERIYNAIIRALCTFAGATPPDKAVSSSSRGAVPQLLLWGWMRPSCERHLPRPSTVAVAPEAYYGGVGQSDSALPTWAAVSDQ